MILYPVALFPENEALNQLKWMKPPGSAMPQVVVKWYACANWVLERVESVPNSQRFSLGQRAVQPRHGRVGGAGKGQLRP